MLNLKRILGIAIVLSVVIVIVIVTRHLLEKSPERLVEMLPDNVELALQDLHYTQNENGVPLWTLDADNAEYIKGSQLALLDKVRFEYFASRSFGDVVLNSDKGEFNQDSRKLVLLGNVTVETENNERFFTDRLHFDDVTQQLWTEDAVRLQSPRIDLDGVGMQADIDQGRVLIKHAVKALLRPEPEHEVDQ